MRSILSIYLQASPLNKVIAAILEVPPHEGFCLGPVESASWEKHDAASGLRLCIVLRRHGVG